MNRRASLRASDQDREHVAERLRRAAAEGRLLAEEFEHRLGRALRARTYGELDQLVSDLPGDVVRRGRSVPPVVAVAGAIAIAALAVAVVALAVLIVTGIAAAWVLWMAVAWFVFGRRCYPHRRGRAQIRYAHRRTLL